MTGVPMRHAILGAGGVGGFVGAVLAAAGEPVLLLLRAEAIATHPDTLSLDSSFGHLDAPVTKAELLDRDVDVLWVTTKATQLEKALGSVPDPALAQTVVPLLNGVDTWRGSDRCSALILSCPEPSRASWNDRRRDTSCSNLLSPGSGLLPRESSVSPEQPRYSPASVAPADSKGTS